MRGVAVDTNAFGHGRLNLREAADWARMLQTVGAELWVPEPVAWELAEHAVDGYTTAQVQHRSSRREAQAAGWTVPEWPERDREDLLAEALAAIAGAHPNLRVLPLDPSDAAESLKDQVLLRGSAKRKNPTERDAGVKTGAADLASVRLLHRHVGGVPYAVVGADKDWIKAYEALGWPLPLMYSTWHAAKRDLFTVLSAVGTGPAVLSYLAGNFTADAEEIGSIAGSVSDLDEEYGLTVRTYEVEREGVIAGLSGLETYEEAREIAGSIFVLADVGVHVQRYNEGDGGWSSDYYLYADALLRGSLVLEVHDDVIVKAVAGSDEPFTILKRSRFRESEEAFEGALEALRGVSGLEDLDWPEAYDGGDPTWEAEFADGRSVTLSLHGSVFDEWNLEAAVDGERVGGLVSQYEDEAWVGGTEGMYMEPPWLIADADGAHVRHAEWALAATLIARSWSTTSAA